MAKYYKNYVIDETSVLIDYSRDFNLENFNYSKYEAELESLIKSKTDITNVYFLNGSSDLVIICNDLEVEYVISDLINFEIDMGLEDDLFYKN